MKSVASAVLVSASVAATVTAVTADSTVAPATNEEKQEFNAYLASHNKNYDTVDEYNARLDRFVYYDRQIKEHNEKKANFTLGHNQFSDWYANEYEAILTFRLPEQENITTN